MEISKECTGLHTHRTPHIHTILYGCQKASPNSKWVKENKNHSQGRVQVYLVSSSGFLHIEVKCKVQDELNKYLLPHSATVYLKQPTWNRKMVWQGALILTQTPCRQRSAMSFSTPHPALSQSTKSPADTGKDCQQSGTAFRLTKHLR